MTVQESLPGGMRKRIYSALMMSPNGGAGSRVFDTLILLLILLNVFAVVLESMQSLGTRYAQPFRLFEIFSVVVFSVEYLLRVWTAVEDARYQQPVFGRLRYALTPLALIDLLAVLPFYLTFLAVDLRILRILRVFRLLRIAKIARYSRTIQLFFRVLKKSRSELLLSLMIMLVLLLLSASLMYSVEHEVQPAAFSSIPAAMWWAIATLTTVGYGDVYPVTWLGKLLASFVAIFGIGMFALPTGVLGAAFLQELKTARKPAVCQHCGKALDSNEDQA